jgi:hypothetical protein
VSQQAFEPTRKRSASCVGSCALRRRLTPSFFSFLIFLSATRVPLGARASHTDPYVPSPISVMLSALYRLMLRGSQGAGGGGSGNGWEEEEEAEPKTKRDDWEGSRRSLSAREVEEDEEEDAAAAAPVPSAEDEAATGAMPAAAAVARGAAVAAADAAALWVPPPAAPAATGCADCIGAACCCIEEESANCCWVVAAAAKNKTSSEITGPRTDFSMQFLGSSTSKRQAARTQEEGQGGRCRRENPPRNSLSSAVRSFVLPSLAPPAAKVTDTPKAARRNSGRPSE